jgi:hypothetical protein
MYRNRSDRYIASTSRDQWFMNWAGNRKCESERSRRSGTPMNIICAKDHEFPTATIRFKLSGEGLCLIIHFRPRAWRSLDRNIPGQRRIQHELLILNSRGCTDPQKLQADTAAWDNSQPVSPGHLNVKAGRATLREASTVRETQRLNVTTQRHWKFARPILPLYYHCRLRYIRRTKCGIETL